MKNVAIFGSTGSIGKTLIKIIDDDKKNFEIVLLAANRDYINLIKQATAKEFLSLNEEILKVDLINKGLMKAETWEQIERVIIKLQDATSLQT